MVILPRLSNKPVISASIEPEQLSKILPSSSWIISASCNNRFVIEIEASTLYSSVFNCRVRGGRIKCFKDKLPNFLIS